MSADGRPMVRRADLADADAIGQVHVVVQRQSYRGQMPSKFLDDMRVDRRIVRWRRILTKGELDVWVAEVDGKLVGFAGSSEAREDDLSPGTAELQMINVLEDHAGQGVGGALLAALDEHWRRSGVTEAVLWVLPGNERAIGVYTHLGWTPDGTTRELVFGGEFVPAIRMRKPVARQGSGPVP